MKRKDLFDYRKQLIEEGFKEESEALFSFLFDECLSIQEIEEVTKELIAEGKLPSVKQNVCR